ncbi:DUF2161 family putative PD-(D/E)XK-type phosphodiesterase [Candidatus Izemoplasma sp. B36]|uniref:DUF2161 family putative PD-(D/E)XK-type phosphodiesterase n=1 Tax=Candidatus Izemoplasma sp. B36 TaxID=3242468 RepID=UPI003555F3A8
MLEKQMFQPIKEYLTNLGYAVKAEVKNVDILATKNEKIIVVEMKKQFSIKLLYQGCDRQRMFDHVYIAILHPGYKKTRTREFMHKVHLVHRLRLGLMLVDVNKNKVEVRLDPKEYKFKRNYKKRKLLLDEFNARKLSINIGGSNKKKIMTKYREDVIEVAKTLVEGALSTKMIKEKSGIKEATKILYNNYYYWFERVERGIYKLTEKGKKELEYFVNIVDELTKD